MKVFLLKYRFLYSSIAIICILASSASYALSVEDKRFTLEGVFTDGKSMQPVAEVEVTITNLQTNNATTTITGDNGSFSIVLRDESIYSVTGYKTNYFFSGTENFSTIGRPSPSLISLDMNIRQIIIGENYEIEGIEFGVNNSELTSKSKSVLEDVVRVMMQNPAIQIEIGCHTDARGNDVYNLELSQKRAEAIVRYLEDIGISEERLAATGYGEEFPLNHCENGVKCAQLAHEENRRTEFKVLSTHY